ncbi:sugar O-acetyltransferase [Lacticaseibacillus saniviri]|uniref:Acetyltransferase n=1 Tax=Lacticaseibacillus saniviri JCM 17471 = DSM 24301 TaxID=1293598 RepID=A0A0R2MY59_9LACO|nr:sugar O-acetyltransferase [Lacticaseibacillus saniviri]KRO17115.1 galactoside O-acetyltransferase [Lacticaseibacillus saniviri JCM 17471 = DSM 24301]MCG4282196.1 sugar O-acetyltransferase [Lacticaseibacillus saniviri]
MRTQREKMLAGDLYIASDPELQALSHRGKTIVRTYNETTEEQNDLRRQLLEQLWAKVGEHAYIEPPFHTDYGQHTEVGDNFYMNYDGIIIDVAPVKIGNNVMFGPRAGIYTAGHPIDAAIRNEGLEFGKPITIGNDVWVGGNVVINPGVTIGSNVVIGSGSVVTKDIPDNVVAVGNPCHVLRAITTADTELWEKEKQRYFEN